MNMANIPGATLDCLIAHTFWVWPKSMNTVEQSGATQGFSLKELWAPDKWILTNCIWRNKTIHKLIGQPHVVLLRYKIEDKNIY